MRRARRPLDGLDEDVRDHIESETRDNIDRGMLPDEARRQAFLRFGNVAVVKEDVRTIWVSRHLDELRQDVRYALRALRRNPAYAAVVIVTVALGIGANAAIFSLVDAALLRRLPVDRPQELVFLDSAGSEGSSGAPPYPCFERFRSGTTSFAGMAAFAADELRVAVDGQVEQVFGQVASGDFFVMLGVQPALGRLLTRADEALEPAVAVIGHAYWHRRFGADPAAIGRTIVFRDRAFTIVGVTPASFRGLHPGRHVDVTLPITQERGMTADAGARWFNIVARLGPGTNVQRATAEVDAIYQAFVGEGRTSNEMHRMWFDRMQLTPASRGHDGLRSRFSTPLYALSIAAAIVLLIACVNLANLLLARGAARKREFAVRLALGAGRARVFRQLITETLLLFAAGAGAGLLLARAMAHGVAGFFATGRNPIVLDVPFDWRLMAFGGAIALVAGLMTGAWPALQAIGADLQSAAKDGDTRATGVAATGRALVILQIALSLVLLAGAAMFVRTIVNLRAVDPGFRPAHVLTMSLTPDFTGPDAQQRRIELWTRGLERVRELPGVRASSLSVLTPLSGRDVGREIAVPGFEPSSDADRMVHLNHVSEDYFRTFGIDLVEGRAFTPRDAEGALKVAVLNEAAARFYFRDRSPVGDTIRFGESVHHVVGVVRDHKHRSLREETPRFVFVPLWQPVHTITRTTLALSSTQPVPQTRQAVAREMRALDAGTLVSDVMDVEEQIDATLVSERLLSAIASALAALAVALAAIGLYGILSYVVARRRIELGIRMALGASRSRIVGGVFRGVLGQVAAGLAIGMPAALAAGQAAEQLLFGVGAADPEPYVLAAGLLIGVAAAAAWTPARRAGSLDPAELLRRN